MKETPKKSELNLFQGRMLPVLNVGNIWEPERAGVEEDWPHVHVE
jgi:hypothetical protein